VPSELGLGGTGIGSSCLAAEAGPTPPSSTARTPHGPNLSKGGSPPEVMLAHSSWHPAPLAWRVLCWGRFQFLFWRSSLELFPPPSRGEQTSLHPLPPLTCESFRCAEGEQRVRQVWDSPGRLVDVTDFIFSGLYCICSTKLTAGLKPSCCSAATPPTQGILDSDEEVEEMTWNDRKGKLRLDPDPTAHPLKRSGNPIIQVCPKSKFCLNLHNQ
jgi:hypothetical protein